MKKRLPYSILLFSLSVAAPAIAQSDRFAFAITDVQKEGANWNFLRRVDLETGNFSEVLLKGNDASIAIYDAQTRKQSENPISDPAFAALGKTAFANGVAALAYDSRHQRLYYTPMFIDQLRYIDLRTMKVFVAATPEISALKIKSNDQSNIITRMVIASDGNGYALTNDGHHLIRFGTGKNPAITDLGSLVDDPSNNSVSVHNSCSSYGGDMIADDDDNLYVFSARNQVFRIDLNSKVATHLGSIKGLPQTFTVNGAAVDHENRIFVTSAVTHAGMFRVDLKTMEAVMISSRDIWRTADLANGNFYSARSKPGAPELPAVNNEIADQSVRIFPNPVTENKFVTQFMLEPGNYTLQVTDMLGRQSLLSLINVTGKGQTDEVVLPVDTKKGVYFVKITDRDKKAVFTQKILVQ